MTDPLPLDISPVQLEAFCQRWQVAELAVFGSVLRADFNEDSDVDLLLSFDPAARWSLFDLATMEDELEVLFGREVDVMTRRSVEQSANPIRRAAILQAARPLFRAA